MSCWPLFLASLPGSFDLQWTGKEFSWCADLCYTLNTTCWFLLGKVSAQTVGSSVAYEPCWLSSLHVSWQSCRLHTCQTLLDTSCHAYTLQHVTCTLKSQEGCHYSQEVLLLVSLIRLLKLVGMVWQLYFVLPAVINLVVYQVSRDYQCHVQELGGCSVQFCTAKRCQGAGGKCAGCFAQS